MNQHPAYELFEELGRGANTVVYRSYDLSLGREVAIKQLDENSRRDPRQLERFLREAQFLAQFEHDNVLRVYSVDSERGWIIMELMKGTLASLIAAGPSDPDLVRSILKQTLEALAFLHEKNKVHGTVRPTNLLINEKGRVKLSEFEQTDLGGELRAPKGSKKYLAPELIRPEFGEFGPPLDLYCLAFSALELLKGPQFDSIFPGTGKGAIDADMAWLRWHSSNEELASTRKLVKGIPEDLAQVLDHMLKKRVADRPQSAQAVLKDLADRPLIAVPIAGVETEDGANPEQHIGGPVIVRTLATPQTVTPRGKSPLTGVGDQATGRSPAAAKSAAAAKVSKSGVRPAERFSKDWFNQQLGRPYVLYPLCAVIILGALWFSFGRSSGGVPDKSAAAKKTDSPKPIVPEPIIKSNDVTIQVTPADAQLKIGGVSQALVNGAYVQKLEEGKPLEIAAQLDGFEPVTHTFSADELAKLGNKVAIELAREKPRLPASLVAKSGAPVDPDVQLPSRALAARLSGRETMEFALVKPGAYNFGSSETKLRPNELARRSVRVEQPFYIALTETTNAQYNRFFEAEGESKAGNRWQKASRKWAEPQHLDPIKNQLPATNVSNEEAEAFCTWIGGRLPTEIEWESAVRGPQDNGYPYPWGSAEPNRERCRIFYGEKLERGEGGPVPVEQLAAGASPLGLMHAIGNAAEWCQDSEKTGGFILRGCSIATANINDVRVTWRGHGDSQGEEFTGFRAIVPISARPTKPSTAPRVASH